MWKKLENFAGSRPDTTANDATELTSAEENSPESPDDAWLVDTVGSHAAEDESGSDKEAPAATPEMAPTQRQQEMPLSLGAYTEAVNKFTKSASAFIEHLPLLAEARQAYDEASKASTELRRVLDAGDENLRTLMSHLEQMVNVQLVNGPKTPGDTAEAPSRLGPVRVGEDAKGAAKRFP
jgi:hypothetical protein